MKGPAGARGGRCTPNAPSRFDPGWSYQTKTMSQRNSEYKRQPGDLYITPPWVVECLHPYLRGIAKYVWEPAAGTGKMADALRSLGYEVHASDISDGRDFLKAQSLPSDRIQAIVTNPPFSTAREFIERALDLTAAVGRDRDVTAL